MSKVLKLIFLKMLQFVTFYKTKHKTVTHKTKGEETALADEVARQCSASLRVSCRFVSKGLLQTM